MWRVQPADPPRAGRLADELGIDPITAQLLLNRGVQDRAQGERFLDPRVESLADPFELPDMERGIRRLLQAIAHREPILLFSDSDVDGLSASVILYEVLRSLGAVVRARVSNRIADGYGLPRALVHQIARSATKLLLLVDCGTNQPEEIRCLASRGIDTIVIDHHVPLDGCVKPHALINPHCARGAGRELCSAGLAVKVAQALLGGEALRERLAAYLDVAALGTLADCAPLVGDNRAILSEGMQRIVRSHRPGLKRLCEATRLHEPDPGQITRRLVPRLNASGRLGDATAAWKLLRRDESMRVEEWLAATDTAHGTAKSLHRRIMAEAYEQVNRVHFREQFVVMVSGRGWHQGLMGPLASQLAQRYGRPAIAIAMDERRGIGSGRSIPLFNLLEALQACQGVLVRFGGHAQACGLTVDRRQWEEFRERLNHEVRHSLGERGLIRNRVADVELPLSAIQPRWVGEIERLAPFGHGNPRPTVLLRGLTIEPTASRTAVLSDGTRRIAARGRLESILPEGRYDVMASPTLAAGESVLTMSDVRASAGPS